MPATQKKVEIANPLEGLLGYELRRASLAAMSAYASALEPLGLRPSEALMLMIIGANPGRTQSDFCRALMLQPANMTPLVSQLVQAGWLEKRAAEGRSIALYLTKDGAALFKKIKRAVTQHEKEIARRVPKSTRVQLVKALRIICDDALKAADMPRPCAGAGGRSRKGRSNAKTP